MSRRSFHSIHLNTKYTHRENPVHVITSTTAVAHEPSLSAAVGEVFTNFIRKPIETTHKPPSPCLSTSATASRLQVPGGYYLYTSCYFSQQCKYLKLHPQHYDLTSILGSKVCCTPFLSVQSIL